MKLLISLSILASLFSFSAMAAESKLSKASLGQTATDCPWMTDTRSNPKSNLNQVKAPVKIKSNKGIEG